MSQRLRIEDLPEWLLGADGGNEDEEDNDTDSDEDLDSEDEDENEDEDTVESLKEKLTKAEEERDKYFRRMRRADRAKSHADNELKTLREGGAKELADAVAENEKLKAQLAELSGTDSTAIIREEFRDYDSVKWHNPKLAFELLDLEEVDVEDGKVDAASLKDAITKLAKDHPYLVKTEAKGDGEDGEDEEDKGKGARPPSGTRSLGGRKPKNTRQKEIADKFHIAGRL